MDASKGKNVKVSCDTKGMSVTTFTDAKCEKGAKEVTYVWGTCLGSGSKYVFEKGAEALKMAVTGAALALVASQF